MHTVSEKISPKQINKYFGPATVLDFNQDERTAFLEELNTWCKLAIPYQHKLEFGDTVLTAGEDINSIYIIGILHHSSDYINNADHLTLSNGHYAALNKSGETEKIQVCNKSGELLFEYNSKSGKSIVNIPSGDLEFVAGNGSISFISDQDISFKSNHNIEIESLRGIRISVRDIIGKMLSSITLNHKMKLTTPHLNILSQRGDIQVENLKYTGSNFSATLKNIRVIAGKLESIANDIINKAKNIFNRADELTEVKTGRMRTLVKSTLHIKSKNSYLNSEEDFKINAEKIHLG